MRIEDLNPLVIGRQNIVEGPVGSGDLKVVHLEQEVLLAHLCTSAALYPRLLIVTNFFLSTLTLLEVGRAGPL